MTVRSSHTWISPILSSCRQFPTPRPASTFECCVHSASDRCSRPTSPCERPRAPAVIMVDQQFVRLATARVPFHSSQHTLHIVVGVYKHVSAIHVILVIRSFQSSRVPWRVLLSQHRVTSSSVRVLAAPESFNFSAGIDSRTLLDPATTPNRVVSSVHSRVQWSRTATCTVVFNPRVPRTGHHQLHACPLQDPLQW